MKYFVAQIKTTCEEKYIEVVVKKLAYRQEQQSFFFPKRKMLIRRAGLVCTQILPIFASYIFVQTESIDADLYSIMSSTKGFYRFLQNNQNIIALHEGDLKLVEHFIGFGRVAEISKVFFDENDKITVASGPLQGLEGRIKKIDKRKKRAKIQLDLYGENFLLDLSFEIIKKDA